MEKLVDLAKQYLYAYEAKDLRFIEEMLSQTVELEDWNLSVKGKANFLHETQKNFDAAKDIKITINSLFQGDNQVAAELLIELDQGSLRLNVVDIIRFNEAGQIIGVRAYKG